MPEKSLAFQLLAKFENDRVKITHYAAIAERCPLPAFIVGNDAATILYINPAYHTLTGRTLFDLQNGEWVDAVIHRDDRERVRSAWAAFVKDGQMHPHWHRYVHVNGTVFEGMTLISRVDGNGYVGFMIPQCGKQNCPVRSINADLWKLWEVTKILLNE